jgi:hypothetical protein
MKRGYQQRGDRRAFTEIHGEDHAVDSFRFAHAERIRQGLKVGPSERPGWLAPAVLIVATLMLGVLVALFGPGALR